MIYSPVQLALSVSHNTTGERVQGQLSVHAYSGLPGFSDKSLCACIFEMAVNHLRLISKTSGLGTLKICLPLTQMKCTRKYVCA